MANPEHVDILKQGVEVWNQWREENPLIEPDLRRLDLISQDFCGVDFARTNLKDSNLNHTNLSYADLSDSDLVDAQLISVDFTYAKLTYSNCSGAILKNSNLTAANLNAAKLERTDLSGANLNGASLCWANLKDAILKGVTLYSANLSRACLDNSDFSQSIFGFTLVSHVDLSKAIGIDIVEHNKPSSIGIDTIFESRGQIPTAFLRGCGVPENFINYMKSLTINPIDYYSCFISYSHKDKSFAQRLHDQLQARGIRCWLDEHQMLPGDDIYEQVDRGIRMWDKVLLCCSQHSLTSWWVDNEISTSFNKEQQLMEDRGKKVLSLIPLNLDGYMFSDEWASGKRQQIKERLAADFTGWETDNSKFEEQFERVVKALQIEGAREEVPISRLL